MHEFRSLYFASFFTHALSRFAATVVVLLHAFVVSSGLNLWEDNPSYPLPVDVIVVRFAAPGTISHTAACAHTHACSHQLCNELMTSSFVVNQENQACIHAACLPTRVRALGHPISCSLGRSLSLFPGGTRYGAIVVQRGHGLLARAGHSRACFRVCLMRCNDAECTELKLSALCTARYSSSAFHGGYQTR